MTVKKFKKVVYLDELSLISLFYAFLYRLLLFAVFYRNPTQFFKKKRVQKFCSMLGIKLCSYENVPGDIHPKTFELNRLLENKVLNELLVRHKLYQYKRRKFGLNNQAIDKLNATLKQHCFSDCFSDGISSIPLIEFKFLQHGTKVIFLPSSLPACLQLSFIKKPNLKVVSAYSLNRYIVHSLSKASATLLALVIGKIKNMLPASNVNNKRVKRSNANFNLSKFEIAYFPHESLYYSSSFKKSYFYEQDPHSPLFYKKVLTAFFSGPEKRTLRYLGMKNMPWVNLQTISFNKTAAFILFLSELKYCLNGRKLNLVIASLLLMKYFSKVNIDYEKIKNFSSLKLIHAHYDVLFPPSFVFACYLRGVKTVSLQERFLQYTYFGNLAFDHYFVASSALGEILPKYGYCCETFHCIGLPRVALIDLAESRFKKSIYFKYHPRNIGKSLVICFGLFPMDRYETGKFGENGTSIRNNIQYIKDIINLSVMHKDCFFLIRFKEVNSVLNRVPKQLLMQVNGCDNVKIDCEMKRNSSYLLVSMANLIIGKRTSIMEEALAAGKKVIYYDSENSIHAFNSVLNEADIIAHDFNDLKCKFDSALKCQKENPAVMHFRDKYLASQFADPYTAFRDTLKYIYSHICI